MTRPTRTILGCVGLAFAAAVIAYPLYANGYYLALGISILYFTVLATAWAMFSGPTRYISLATAAFFGLGAYTAAVLGETMPWPVVLLAAAVLGALVAAAGVARIHAVAIAKSLAERARTNT